MASEASQSSSYGSCYVPAVGRPADKVFAYHPLERTYELNELIRDLESHTVWHSLPKIAQEKLVRVGFGTFIDILPIVEHDQKIPYILVECWWDSTNMSYLPIGEMTLTHCMYL